MDIETKETKINQAQQIAEARIQKAIDENAKTLSLGSIDYLIKIPKLIAKATSIKKLQLGPNLALTSLPQEIGQLKNLEILDLQETLINKIPKEIITLEHLSDLLLSSYLNVWLPFLKKIPTLKTLTITNYLELKFRYLAIKTFYTSTLSPQDREHLNPSQLSQLPKGLFTLSNLVSLTVNRSGLKSLNPEIVKLTNLKTLNISENKITSLPAEIGRVEELIDLNISYNLVREFPSEIKYLNKLTTLNASNNHITKLPPEIGELNNLTMFNISNNRINKLPQEIRNLKNLQKFNVSNNQIHVLPNEIGELQELTSFYLSGNQISKIPRTIGNLRFLSILSIGYEENSWEELINRGREFFGKFIPAFKNRLPSYRSTNKIQGLPQEIQQLRNLRYLNLKETSLQIPPEILNKTNEPKSILSYYFSLYPKGEPALNTDETESTTIVAGKSLSEIKLLIVGQGAVGKTSLIHQIIYGKFDPNQNKTEGISIKQWIFNDRRQTKLSIKLNIWDFGGQEIMHATHQFFLTKRSLYLLVLDSRLTQEENRVEYWLKIIQSFGGESPVLIIGNKIDQHPLDIDGTGLQKKYPNIVSILKTSAATGKGIEELKAEIAKQIDELPHVRDLLPETWFTVKSKLEELAKNKNFFTQDEYFDLCNSNDISDEVNKHTLIGFLHDLGVVLHFQDDPRLENLGILNPQWVTNGVYKILNSHELFQNQGKLTLTLLNQILDLPEYPSNKRLFIIDMMKKFELCYDIEPDKSFLIPDLLPKDQPELNFEGIPAFEYFYPVLPSSVITRFIVRMNQKIYNNHIWRTGVVLKIGENTALVKADIEDRKISISIDGLEHTRRDALSAIRYQLDEIHETIKGLNPQKRVPIPEAPNAEPLEYEYLLQLENDGFEEHPVKDGNRLFKVNVRKLLSGVISESERKQSIGNTTNIYVGGDFKGGNIVSGEKNQASVENIEKKKPRKKKS